jgi:hypothetical protein
VNAVDARGRTALALAVKAWILLTRRRSPDSVKALLDAGAGAGGISAVRKDEVDRLLHCFFTDAADS